MKAHILLLFVIMPILIFGQSSEISNSGGRAPIKSSSELSGKKQTDKIEVSGSRSNVGANGSRTYMVDRNGNQYELNKAYYENKLIELDDNIRAIDVKIEYVNSNEEERNLANQNGWFTDMENVKRNLQTERLDLVTKIASLE